MSAALSVLLAVAAAGLLCAAVSAGGAASCPRVDGRRRLLALGARLGSERERRALLRRLNPDVAFVLSAPKPRLAREPFSWQRVRSRQVYVYSAFYETRPAADGPAVRVVGTGWQAAYNDVGDLFCHLWYDAFDYAVSVGPAVYRVIYPSTLHHRDWSSHFILCPLPVGVAPAPYAVSVGPSPTEDAGNALSVQNREPTVKSNTHALCISALYNRFDQWRMLVEMFELQQILGVTEITIYDHSASEATRRALRHYVRAGRVNVLPWPLPAHLRLNVNVLCQRAAYNDCLYRMSHRHRFVTFTDLDEILVPRRESTLPALMRTLEWRRDVGEFLFQHAYFRRNVSRDEPPLVTQSSFWRTDVVTPPGRVRSKAMYVAERAVSIDLHYAYTLLPGAASYVLAPEEGMLHHYRRDPMESFYKHPERYTYIEDRYMQQYKTRLVDAYQAMVLSVS